MRPMMGLGWMEGIEDETSGWSDIFGTEKRRLCTVVFKQEFRI